MLQTWEMITFVCYGIPCVSLYIFVLYQLIFKPGYSSAFFKLSIVIGIIDLMDYTTIWLDLKLNLYPYTAWIYPYIKFKIFFAIVHFLKFYLSKVREILIVSTAANRFTALCFPNKHVKIWERCFWPAVFVSIGIPILTTFHILCGEGVLNDAWPELSTNSTKIYVIDYKTSWFKLSNAMINAIHTTIASILSLTLNTITLLYLTLRQRGHKNQHATVSQKAERNLFIIAVLDFGMDLISAANQYIAFFLRGYQDDPVFYRLYFLYPWTYDIVNLSRPILLVVICRQLRHQFFSIFWKYKSRKIMPIAPPIPTVTVL